MKISASKNTPMSTTTFPNKDENGDDVDQKLYRGMIGSLLYITSSRPDIMFSICLCARYQSNPKESHLKAVKKNHRYINNTVNYDLFYLKSSTFDLLVMLILLGVNPIEKVLAILVTFWDIY